MASLEKCLSLVHRISLFLCQHCQHRRISHGKSLTVLMKKVKEIVEGTKIKVKMRIKSGSGKSREKDNGKKRN